MQRETGRTLRIWIMGMCLSLCLSILPTSLFAEEGDRRLTEGQISSFVDEFFTSRLDRITGGVISVVDQNGVILERGYGKADVESERSMDPKQTEVRVASISKIFTTLAVMQLKEAGKVSLDEKIHTYMKEWDPKSDIRLKHLLTHTAGFDETLFILSKHWNVDGHLGSLKDIPIPAVVRKPGEVKSYSNFGMSLAGYLVEQVSGDPFAEYIEEHITAPLSMSRSGFRLTSEQAANLARGYDGGKLLPEGGVRPFYTPGGGFVSTAEDMGKFMRAMLNHGEYNEHRIIKEQTLDEMMNLHATFRPELGGMAYGWAVIDRSVETREHSGSLPGHKSGLWIFPSSGIGVFLSINGEDDGFQNEFIQAFLNRYTLFMQPVSQSVTTMKLDIHTEESIPSRELEGSYIITRIPEKAVFALNAKWNSSMKFTLRAINDKMIRLGTSTNGKLYSLGEDGLWHSSATDLFAAKRTEDGIYLQFSGTPSTDFRPLKWQENRNLHIGIIGFFVVGLLVSSVLGAIGMVRRRRLHRTLLAVSSWWGLLFVALIAYMGLIPLTLSPEGIETTLRWLLLMPVLLLLFAVMAVISWIWSGWRKKSLCGVREWGGFTLQLLFLMMFVWYLDYWNLLGWSGLK